VPGEIRGKRSAGRIAKAQICVALNSLGRDVNRSAPRRIDQDVSSVRLVITVDVRREAIAEAAAKLRAADLITCGRGEVTILDRAKLEAHSCECYASAKNEVDRLLPYRHSMHADAGIRTRITPRYHPNADTAMI